MALAGRLAGSLLRRAETAGPSLGPALARFASEDAPIQADASSHDDITVQVMALVVQP